MSLSKKQFASIKIGDMVKDERAGEFKAVEQIDNDLLILSSGFVVDRKELSINDLKQEETKHTAKKVLRPTPSPTKTSPSAKLREKYPTKTDEILHLSAQGMTISQIEAGVIMQEAGKHARR